MENNELFGAEIEILEFKAGGNAYGVDVSDIKEILSYDKKPTPIPNAHSFIEGMIMPRDYIIAIVDFVKSLKLIDIDDNKHEMLIVTEFNHKNIAFHVDSVLGIHRVRSTDITMPEKKLTTTQKDVVVGTLTRGDKKIEIVELRNIIKIINPDVKVDE